MPSQCGNNFYPDQCRWLSVKCHMYSCLRFRAISELQFSVLGLNCAFLMDVYELNQLGYINTS